MRGPWAMHPDADELLVALAGSVTIELFDHDGNQRVLSTQRVCRVVPRGRRHRHVDAPNLALPHPRRASAAQIGSMHASAAVRRPDRPGIAPSTGRPGPSAGDADLGRYTVRARATDAAGHVQPDVPPWNRLGYGNNAIEVIYVDVEERTSGQAPDSVAAARTPMPRSWPGPGRAFFDPPSPACSSDRAIRS